MMPPGTPPIALFRAFAKNLPMTGAMRGWGSYELSKELSLGLREREIVIDRTCARCGCEYEWGVHVAYFAAKGRLGRAQLASLTHGSPDDACWTDQRDRLLIGAVDALHDTSDVPEPLWGSWPLSSARLNCLTFCCCAAGTTRSASPRGLPALSWRAGHQRSPRRRLGNGLSRIPHHRRTRQPPRPGTDRRTPTIRRRAHRRSHPPVDAR